MESGSRADRLLALIENGGSVGTRRAAAKQLGLLVKKQYQVSSLLPSLLAKLRVLLQSSIWDTRCAAGHACAAIFQSLPSWIPHSSSSMDGGALTTSGIVDFSRFDISQLVASGVSLTGSEGSEYDTMDSEHKSIVHSIKSQINIDANLQGFLTSNDLSVNHCSINDRTRKVLSVKDAVETCIRNAGGAPRSLSASIAGEIASPKEPARKRMKKDGSFSKKAPSIDLIENGPNADVDSNQSSQDYDSSTPALSIDEWVHTEGWPLEEFTDSLLMDLFNPKWEIRHGAATGLREIFTHFGNGAGQSNNCTQQQMVYDHERYLRDALARVLGVLFCDQFGDYVGDHVVAPVRETCAQLAASLIKLLTFSTSIISEVLTCLELTVKQSRWETRHAALLVLKYSLTLSKDRGIKIAMSALSDTVDDVSVVAASVLRAYASDINPELVPVLISLLWKLLTHVTDDGNDDDDSATAAPQSYMHLLAELMVVRPRTNKSAPSDDEESVDKILPRLFRFLGHPSTSVRKSCLTTLVTIVDMNQQSWTVDLLRKTLKLLFFRMIIEPSKSLLSIFKRAWIRVLESVKTIDLLLNATCPHFGEWMCLTMQSDAQPIDAKFFVTFDESKFKSYANLIYYVAGGNTVSGSDAATPTLVRATAAQMLGNLSHRMLSDKNTATINYYSHVLLTHLNSKSSMQRLVVGLVLTELNKLSYQDPFEATTLFQRVLECTSERVQCFDEMLPYLSRLFTDIRDFQSRLRQSNITFHGEDPQSVQDVDRLCSIWRENLDLQLAASAEAKKELSDRLQNLTTAVEQFNKMQLAQLLTCQTALASALVYHQLPDKLSPIVRPLVESTRHETDPEMQLRNAQHLAELMWRCANIADSSTHNPNVKIINNLTALLESLQTLPRPSQLVNSDIVTLYIQKNTIGSENFATPSPTIDVSIDPSISFSGGNRRPSTKGRPLTMQQSSDVGVRMALVETVKRFGQQLPQCLPVLWNILTTQHNIASLHVLQSVLPVVHSDLVNVIVQRRLPNLINNLTVADALVRHMSARCIATLSTRDLKSCVNAVVTHILPKLNVTDGETALFCRLGAAEALYCLIDTLQLDIVPYIVLFLVPVLGRMSDADVGVRNLCTQSFAQLVQLFPLESAKQTEMHDNDDDDDDLLNRMKEQRLFLKQLLNPLTIPDVHIPDAISAQLRPYQQAGVNWLWFLNRYNLHGILCDEMGLGKTLQTICVLRTVYGASSSTAMSLVVCPPTLTSHWCAEIEKFVPDESLIPVQYAGPPTERERLRTSGTGDEILGHKVIVASYDIVRRDINVYFSQINWLYCVLDEGHIIKNGKTKISRAMKRISAQHRLILTGTPIQNGVLELWSLFDFLMPGFLGSERVFNTTFTKPIVAAATATTDDVDLMQASEHALLRLHRQVLPFVLRRTKRDVLKELPPRIMQDLPCQLTPLQRILYDHFANTPAAKHIDPTDESAQSTTLPSSYAFQALSYLQNVCNHPRLAFTSDHPQANRILQYLHDTSTTLDDLSHSCKLTALKQLLLDCGIGVLSATESDSSTNVDERHKALIFCQRRSMLDEVERLLNAAPFIQTTSPNGKWYLRLDGAVATHMRQTIVNRLNNDPSIQLLLLTTHVGGVGLNLTSADTVIFVEHAWNPQRDAQAMARAHRLGQRRTVNIYRLITQSTLEQRIIGLQQFKLRTADTVINHKNRLQTNNNDMLDLFSIQTAAATAATSSNSASAEDQDQLNMEQYEQEYNLDNFIKTQLH